MFISNIKQLKLLNAIVGLEVGVVVHRLRERVIKRIHTEKENASAPKRIGVAQNAIMMKMIGTIIEVTPDDIMIMRTVIEEVGPN